jgi:hypothetical protein
MYSIIIALYIDIRYPKDSERSMQRKTTFQITALLSFLDYFTPHIHHIQS